MISLSYKQRHSKIITTYKLMRKLREMEKSQLREHTITVNAPFNVNDSVREKLYNLCENLTDEELSYAVIYAYEELEMRKNEPTDIEELESHEIVMETSQTLEVL